MIRLVKWSSVSDFNVRGDKHIPVKAVVDDALDMGCDSIEKVIIHKNTGDDLNFARR